MTYHFETQCIHGEWLRTQPKVKSVYYVGLTDHLGYEINANQTSGTGSMISFQVDSETTARNPVSYTHLDVYKRQCLY